MENAEHIKQILYRHRVDIEILVEGMPAEKQKLYLSKVVKAEKELEYLLEMAARYNDLCD